MAKRTMKISRADCLIRNGGAVEFLEERAPAAEVTARLAGPASVVAVVTASDESRWAAEFTGDPKLAAEGFTKESYLAFKKAEAGGRVRVFSPAQI